MQTKIRNLGLDDKQRRLTEARNAYQAEKQRLSQLYGPAQELRSEAEAAQDVVNRKVCCPAYSHEVEHGCMQHGTGGVVRQFRCCAGLGAQQLLTHKQDAVAGR